MFNIILAASYMMSGFFMKLSDDEYDEKHQYYEQIQERILDIHLQQGDSKIKGTVQQPGDNQGTQIKLALLEGDA